MTRAQLEALAARVEAAQGADRVLDAEICVALRGYTMHEDSDPMTGIFAFWVGKPWESECINCSNWIDYTSSLDAAASLVPSQYAWTLGQNVHHRTWLASVNTLDADGAPCSVAMTGAATPALALTAAALRARAMEAGDE